jgi:hypothetical protein
MGIIITQNFIYAFLETAEKNAKQLPTNTKKA